MFGYTWIKAFRRRILKNKRFEMGVKSFSRDELFTCNLLARPPETFAFKGIHLLLRSI